MQSSQAMHLSRLKDTSIVALWTSSAFVGQTEMLSQLASTDRTAMMLLGQDDRGRYP